MNKTQIKELQSAIAQMNATDRTKSTFTIEDNFAYFTPESHRAYKISVNVLSETVEEIPKNNYSRIVPDVFTVINYLEQIPDNYRRIPILLGILQNIDESKWDNIQIVHYGY